MRRDGGSLESDFRAGEGDPQRLRRYQERHGSGECFIQPASLTGKIVVDLMIRMC
jgi:hypothetical protein